MNKHSRMNITKDAEAGCPPQFHGARRSTGNEKTTLLPQSAPLSKVTAAAGARDMKDSDTSVFRITATMVAVTGQGLRYIARLNLITSNINFNIGIKSMGPGFHTVNRCPQL